MPFDLQSLLAALGLGAGTPANATPMGGNLPMGGGAAAAPTPAPTSAPTGGGLAGLFGMQPNALGGFGSPGGIGNSGLAGPMSLLGAGAGMLNSSGPGNAGIGSILGSGIGGLVSGGQLDRTNALQQQQQAALQRIAEMLMKQPSGGQQFPGLQRPMGQSGPAAPGPMNLQTPAPPPGIVGQAVQPGAAPGILGQAVQPPAPGPAAQSPMMPGDLAAGGPAPGLARPMGGSAPGGNPFIQMMLQRRRGLTV